MFVVVDSHTSKIPLYLGLSFTIQNGDRMATIKEIVLVTNQKNPR